MTTPPPSTPLRWRGELRRLLKLNEAQAALGWAVILVLVTLVATIYLIQASHIAETGRRVQLLQFELADYKRQNNVLERQIAEAQSLSRLETAARQLGFVLATPNDIEYIIVTDYPADAEPIVLLPTATPVPIPPIETMEEALWLVLKDNITDLRRGASSE
jgi:cell division protein FtsL